MPTPGIGQTGGTSVMRHSAIESLYDSRWVRLASPVSGRREGRLLARNPTELMLFSVGALLGALIGTALPRWKRNYP